METKKRPGRTSKGASILNGFNQTKIYETDDNTKRKLQLQKAAAYRKDYRRRKKAEALGVGLPDDAQDAENLGSAYQMLQDMRWVYRMLSGREKLQKLVNSDDRQFVFMVKELMKIEASLMAAKIRSKEDPAQANQMVFVVLKGLEDEKPIRNMIADGKKDAIDMRQISHAMNPDGSEYEVDGKEGEVHFQVKGGKAEG